MVRKQRISARVLKRSWMIVTNVLVFVLACAASYGFTQVSAEKTVADVVRAKTGQLPDLGGDGVLAVRAGHPGHLELGRAHMPSPVADTPWGYSF